LLKAIELFYQLPAMQYKYKDAEAVTHILVGSMAFAGLSWITPKLAWKKQL
jgi:hypothetical protein